MTEAEEPEDVPPEPDAAESDPPEIPESVPDDWLDQKPFDPAGR
jgi:hypothetical protein